MNNRGFTLVELLGVIVIVGILALVIGISVSSILKSSKTELSGIQIESIEKAAKAYYLKEGINESDLDSEKYSSCVEVQYLIDNDYIDASEIKNPIDSDEMLGSVKITYNSKKYKYTYQERNCSICALVSGKENEIGSKYQCKVKDNMESGFEDGYYFYVLSYNNENGSITKDITQAVTTNLIMAGNIYYDSVNDVGKVATETEKDFINWNTLDIWYGPLQVFNYLYDTTKDWNNVPNVVINYGEYYGIGTAYGGYGGIATDDNKVEIWDFTGSPPPETYENLKARIPSKQEIEDFNHASNAYDYWTLSTNGPKEDTVWYVTNLGDLDTKSPSSFSGVRPVITFKI